MRQPRKFLLLVPTLFLLHTHAFAQTPSQNADDKTDERSDERRLSLIKDVTEDFAHGSLASVRERFSSDLKDSVSENDLKDARDQLTEIAGPFQSQISQSKRVVQDAPVYISRSQCSRYKVELRLMFDDANEIILFRIGPVSDMSAEDMQAAARAVADELQQHQFAGVNAKFNARMKDAMPTDRLEASWMHVMMHLGQFKSMRSARKDPDLDRVDVRCEFENGLMIVRVAFDPAGKVSGLWMLPAETEKDSQA
jgi:predicted RNA-binding protein with PIN domain